MAQVRLELKDLTILRAKKYWQIYFVIVIQLSWLAALKCASQFFLNEQRVSSGL